MSGVSQHDLVKRLLEIYEEKGYISTDTVFEVLSKDNTSLDAVDRICDELLSKGAVIRDDPTDYFDDDEEYDRGKVDYEQLYNEVSREYPEIAFIVDYIRTMQPPQHREWRVLLPQAQNGNLFAKKRLCDMYYRTVLNISYRAAQQYDLPIADTFQDGVIGLILAIDKYDSLNQDAFPSYFPLWIQQSIYRNCAFPTKPIMYFPAHLKTILLNVYQISKAHTCDLCDKYSICPNLIHDLSLALPCKTETAELYLSMILPCYSLDDLLVTTPELLSDNNMQSQEYDAVSDDLLLKQIITSLLDSLTPRESKVLLLRYGFCDGRERTLEEVGKVFNITRERIRQIEEKALRKLRHPARSKKVKDFW